MFFKIFSLTIQHSESPGAHFTELFLKNVSFRVCLSNKLKPHQNRSFKIPSSTVNESSRICNDGFILSTKFDGDLIQEHKAEQNFTHLLGTQFVQRDGTDE